MSFQPRFSYHDELVTNLGNIEAGRAVIDLLPLPPDRALKLRLDAFERATRSSTAIEGNTLDRVAIRRAIAAGERVGTSAEEEVRNYWQALYRLEEFADSKGPITEDVIQELHKIVMRSGAGRFGGKSPYRVLECPVVDTSTGMICYAPPEPKDVPKLMAELTEWLSSKQARSLPAPVRASILSHQFITIHPFNDGNGRTGRLLATAELWSSGYKLRGFLSFEEYFSDQRARYYDSLQMGLPVNYYEGRENCDLSVWIDYFVSVVSKAAVSLHSLAKKLHQRRSTPGAPWEELSRQQQQVLTSLLSKALAENTDLQSLRPTDVESWFGVSDKTARSWLSEWEKAGFLIAVAGRGAGTRTHKYTLSPQWQLVLTEAKSLV